MRLFNENIRVAPLASAATKPAVITASGDLSTQDAATFRGTIDAAKAPPSGYGVVYGKAEVGFSHFPILRTVFLSGGDNTLPQGNPGDVLIVMTSQSTTCRITPYSGDRIQVLNKATESATSYENGDYIDVLRCGPLVMPNQTSDGNAVWQMQYGWWM